MDEPLDATLRRHGGVATRAQLLRVLTRGQLDHAIRRGAVVTAFQRAVCRPWDADLLQVRRRAALARRPARSHSPSRPPLP